MLALGLQALTHRPKTAAAPVATPGTTATVVTPTHFHAMSGGADTMIDSMRPYPSSPNLTPLSYNKLNSRYRPRLSSLRNVLMLLRFR